MHTRYPELRAGASSTPDLLATASPIHDGDAGLQHEVAYGEAHKLVHFPCDCIYRIDKIQCAKPPNSPQTPPPTTTPRPSNPTSSNGTSPCAAPPTPPTAPASTTAASPSPHSIPCARPPSVSSPPPRASNVIARSALVSRVSMRRRGSRPGEYGRRCWR